MSRRFLRPCRPLLPQFVESYVDGKCNNLRSADGQFRFCRSPTSGLISLPSNRSFDSPWHWDINYENTCFFFPFTVSIFISMIRLPPTSISLSESDINLHLREISIYQSLLQQGFTREAIQGYYASIRAPEPQGHPSSQRPQLTSIRKASNDVERPITHKDQPARSRNPDQQTSRPALPIGESGEVVRSASEVCQMRKYRATQATPRTAEYVELHSKRTVGVSKQPAYEEASEEPSSADTETEVVKMSNSRATGSFAPSIVELRAGARLGSECFPPLSHDPSDDYGDQSSQTLEEHSQLQEQGNNREDATGRYSPHIASNLNVRTRHRPRQSSLLHITRSAASPSSSTHSDDSFKSTVTKMHPADSSELERSPRTRTMTYRPRSQTYPWVQSEADDPKDLLPPDSLGDVSDSVQPSHGELRFTATEAQQISANRTDYPPRIVRPTSVTRIEPSPAGTTIITSHRQISSSSPLRGEAEDFVPLKLPSPFSATRRVSSGLHSLPSSIRNTSLSIVPHEIHARSSPNLAVSTPPRSSSIGSITRHLGSCCAASSPDRDFPSSPPRFGDSERSPEPSRSRRAPATPTHRGHETIRETQPRALPKTPRTQARLQQTDGPGTVYDDRVPAYLQPKTPADLARGFHVTNREAAYTAPPGRTARTPATISQTFLSPTRPSDPGEESPSRRARTIRERRERELRRSVIMEEEIWERLRELDGDTIGGRMHWDGPGPGLMNSWRDDFDADRLGDENFDGEGFMRTPRLEPRVQGSVRATRRRAP